MLPVKLLLTACLVLSVFFSCSSEKKTPEEEEPAAENEFVEQAAFVDLRGDSVEVSDFKGKVVLIDFWETWCKPCLESFHTMQQLVEDYPDQFVVLAVTPGFVDTREDAREFAAEHNYDFIYLYDANNLHKKLNVEGIPFKVFVDTEGNFIEMAMGSRGPKGDYQHAEQIIRENTRTPG